MVKDIKSFAIITPENPMGREVSREENAELVRKFEDELSEGRFLYKKVRGKFGGNLEHSYMVFNAPLDTVKYWAGADKYNQKSFFMCESKYDEENRKTGVVFNYWERKSGSKNAFNMIESSEQWVDVTDKSDGFTAIGRNFKFSIPLDIFAESLSYAESKYESARKILGDDEFESMLNESIHNSGFCGWSSRARLNHVMK